MQFGSVKESCMLLQRILVRGDRVAQFVEHRLEIQKAEVRTTSGAQEKFVSFSESKMLC